MKNIVISLVVFGVLDFIAMATFMKKLAVDSIKPHLTFNNGELVVHTPSALIVYIAMIILSAFFLAPRILGMNNIWPVLGLSFLFGASCFAIFDFTNGALIKDYPFKFMLIDTCWGGVLFSVSGLLMWKFNS